MPAKERVLLVAPNVGREVEMPTYVLSALRRVGCETSVFDYELTRVVPRWLKSLLPGRWRRHVSPRRFASIQQADVGLANQALLTACRRFRPSLILFLRGERISGQTIEALRHYGTTVVNWITDEIRLLFTDAPTYQAFTQAFDAWFVADVVYGEQLHAPRHVKWLPLACDPDVHRPVTLSDEDRRQWSTPICFIGGQAPEREPFLEAVADLGLAIWGPFWERTQNPRLRACVRGTRFLPPEIWTKIFSAADIVLDIHREFAHTGPNMKCFEALACGGFLLCDWKPQLEQLFGGRVATFRSPEELRQQCQFYLANPSARDTHRQALRDCVLSQHTYVHRIQTILHTVEQLRAHARP